MPKCCWLSEVAELLLLLPEQVFEAMAEAAIAALPDAYARAARAVTAPGIGPEPPAAGRAGSRA